MTDTTEQTEAQAQAALGAVDTEGARRATGVSTAPSAGPGRRTSEVLERPVRRRFTAEYKQRILAEADGCTKPGMIGELLRREGLYSSHLSKWRIQREEGITNGLSKQRGRQSQDKNPLAEENARLQKEINRLQTSLTHAQTIIEVQKKLSQLLGPIENPLQSEQFS